MRNQRGASLLFLMLVVALGVLLAAWMALPWISASRQERIEKDIVRGVAPSATPVASNAAARERARIAEFAEAHGGFKSVAGSESYRALSAPCRSLIDAYVGVLDKPADASTDQAALRASVADIERRFDAECSGIAAADAAPTLGSAAEMRRLGANLDAYRALSPACRGYVDAFVGLSGQAGLTPSDRDRIADADRLFTEQCTARPAEAKVAPDVRAGQAEESRLAACASKRQEADSVRAVVDMTLGEEPPAPGETDLDKRERHASLDANRARLEALDAELAAHCP